VSNLSHFDVIIIGSGAGGGTLAYHLAPSGKRILLLERGGYLPREKDNWDARAVFVDEKYRAKEVWYDKDGNPFHPGIYKSLARPNADQFSGTAYSHDALGTKNSFDATTGTMLKKFYEDWYAPNNANLVIAGDVQPDAVLAIVNESYGKIQRRPVRRARKSCSNR